MIEFVCINIQKKRNKNKKYIEIYVKIQYKKRELYFDYKFHLFQFWNINNLY